jgi:thiol-disulfide isomerase/thioredoxin
MSETLYAGPPAGSFACPRCGFAQSAAAAECSRCGVVFAKLRPLSPIQSPSTRPAESGAWGSLAGALLLAAVAGATVFLLIPRSQPPAPKPAAGPEKLANAAAPKSPPKPAVPSPPASLSPPSQSPPGANLLPEAPAVPPPVEAKLARLPYSWYEGSQGYRWAMEEAAETGLPVAVYFYTDWCPYCRQLDSEILRAPQVLEYFTHVIKVKVNPEDGPEEQEISDAYGVTSYPSFFIESPARGRAVRIRERHVPEEFVTSCQTAARGYRLL